VDRERAALALDALAALADDDATAFATVVAGAGLLPEDAARDAHPALRDVLGDFLAGPTTLDAPALVAFNERAAAATQQLASLAMAAAPRPQDLALARMLGQLVAVLARLGATLDWVGLARAEPS
jgi:hypothetical protein